MDEGKGYLPWMGGRGTYLGMREGLPTLDRGGRGTYLGQGGERTYLGWERGYLSWDTCPPPSQETEKQSEYLLRGGMPHAFRQEDLLVPELFWK